MKRVKVISVNSELGAGTRGSGLGFDAIRVAAWSKGSRYFKEHPPIILQSNNDEVLDDIETAYSVKIQFIVEMYNKIAEMVMACMKKKSFRLSSQEITAMPVAQSLELRWLFLKIP